jgi:hypothetical protein
VPSHDPSLAADDDARPDETRPEESTGVRLPRMRRTSPWSRRLFLIIVVSVALLAPVWLDPITLDQFRGASPFPIPTESPEGPIPTFGGTPNGEELFTVSTTVVRDTFDRADATGWGSAEIGGPYESLGSAGRLATDAGSGVAYLVQSVSGAQVLTGVEAHDVEITFEVAGDALSVDGVFVQAVLRLVPNVGSYRPTLTIGPDGALTVTVNGVVGDAEAALVPPIAIDATGATDGVFRIRAQAIGSDPTTIRLRAWPARQPEPDVWQVSVIDWTGSLQHDGAIGVGWGSATATGTAEGVMLKFDDLLARANAQLGSL